MMNFCVKSGALFESLDMKTTELMKLSFVFVKSKGYGPCVAGVVPVIPFVIMIQM